ncbi:TRM-domain-containing protein [Lojkania enalia]|uniref:tRNA (guanine(26)-N(2))-dimethyltransferase n=1 Tax=Lojkania enalia TaxID=147567 RepID=A0A9P4KH51_9PLEO|nr:TRM-domain-containing protein [Didymosphaeria enalia]
MAARQASAAMPAPEMSANTIDSPPQAGQSISHGGKAYTTIKEGLAYILVPQGIPTSTDPKMSKEDTQRQQVFYNPIQQFNRDLSVLAIKAFGNDLVKRKQEQHDEKRQKAIKLRIKKRRKLEGVSAGKEQTELHEFGEIALKKRSLDESVPKSREPDDDQAAESTLKKRRLAGHDGDTLPSNSYDSSESQNVKTVIDGEPRVVAEYGVQSGTLFDEANSAPRKPDFKILDALSATGSRALRYAKEIPFSTSITANDMSPKATASISLNIKHNKLDDKIKANTGNAIAYMYSFVDKPDFDVIDLDPYGTAAPFLDAAIHALNDDGLLCVTCTDSAIFASHGYLEKTYSQYGGLPLRGDPCHEGGIRLVLNAVASSAARYGKAIEPLLSLSIDYYIRCFIRVRKSANDVRLLAGKTMLVYHCDSGCGSWTTQYLARNKSMGDKNGKPFYKHSFAQAPSANQLCEHCGFKTHLSGPMYGGPLHNVDFVTRVLAQLQDANKDTYPTMDRIRGMLHTAIEEITFGMQSAKVSEPIRVEQLKPLIPKADPEERDPHPFFFIPSALAKVIRCQAPSAAAMRGALRQAGFRVTMSHCKAGSIRTSAPWEAIWHIMLEWARQKAPIKNRPPKGSSGYTILSKGSAHKVDDGTDEDIKTESTHGTTEQPPQGTPISTNKPAESTPIKNQSKDEPPSYLGTSFEVVFDEQLGRDLDRGKYVRYQLAPRENWGPMSRAK